MVRLRLNALARKYGAALVSISSAFGLLSLFAVHVAGFLSALPQAFWPLIDLYFVSSFLGRFSLLLASSFLAARYVTFVLSAIIGGPLSILVPCLLLFQSRYRRFARRQGIVGLSEFVAKLEFAQEKYGYNYGKLINWLVSSKAPRFWGGYSYLSGRIRGGVDYRIEKWSTLLQGFAVLLLLSNFYIDAYGGLIAAGAIVLLVLILPPSPWAAYVERPYLFFGVNPLRFFEVQPLRFFSLSKATVIALSVSFLTGMLHHHALLHQKIGVISSDGEPRLEAIVAVTSYGIIFHSQIDGYWYAPNSAANSIALRPM